MIDEKFKLSSSDFLDKLEREEKERANKPFLMRVTLNFFDFIWYRIILNMKYWPSDIKYKFQDIIYGYADPDVWNLNSFIIGKVYSPLKEFIKNYEEHGMSLPTEFTSDPGSWLIILKKIELAFDSTWDDEFEMENRFTIGMTTKEQKEEHYAKVKEGLELFGKYMMDLWD